MEHYIWSITTSGKRPAYVAWHGLKKACNKSHIHFNDLFNTIQVELSYLALTNLSTKESVGKAIGAGAANNRKKVYDLNSNNNKSNVVIIAEKTSQQFFLMKKKDKRSKVTFANVAEK